jgi:hypothetical protein
MSTTTVCDILNKEEKGQIQATALADGHGMTVGNMIEELVMVATKTKEGQNGGGWEDWIPTMRTIKVATCKVTAIATFSTIFYVYLQNFGAAVVIKNTISFTFSSLHYILSFAFGDGTSIAMGTMLVMLMTYLKYADAETRIKIGYYLMNNCYKYVKFCATFVLKAVNKLLAIEEVQTRLKSLYNTNFYVGIPYITARFNKTVITTLAHYFCEFYHRENPAETEIDITRDLTQQAATPLSSQDIQSLDVMVDDEIAEGEKKAKEIADAPKGGRRRKRSYKKRKSKRMRGRRTKRH